MIRFVCKRELRIVALGYLDVRIRSGDTLWLV